jgi:protein-S-isoprenylcysteine O-methyltransferase Ste14
MIFKLIVLIVLTTGLVVWSWKSIFNRKLHGFYRFFAFEGILILVILNIDEWFANPFSLIQIFSWLLLIGSIIIAADGFYLLQKMGRPVHGIETTTKLVKTGIYKYIRHPLYGSLFLLSWGVFLKGISWISLILSITICVFSFATAIVEEKENLKRFGEEYHIYMKSTKRFLPFLL